MFSLKLLAAATNIDELRELLGLDYELKLGGKFSEVAGFGVAAYADSAAGLPLLERRPLGTGGSFGRTVAVDVYDVNHCQEMSKGASSGNRTIGNRLLELDHPNQVPSGVVTDKQLDRDGAIDRFLLVCGNGRVVACWMANPLGLDTQAAAAMARDAVLRRLPAGHDLAADLDAAARSGGFFGMLKLASDAGVSLPAIVDAGAPAAVVQQLAKKDNRAVLQGQGEGIGTLAYTGWIVVGGQPNQVMAHFYSNHCVVALPFSLAAAAPLPAPTLTLYPLTPL